MNDLVLTKQSNVIASAAGAPLYSPEHMLGVMVEKLNEDLQAHGYDLEAHIVMWREQGSNQWNYQLRNRFTAQNLSPLTANPVEMMGIMTTLRTFVHIPKADE